MERNYSRLVTVFQKYPQKHPTQNNSTNKFPNPDLFVIA